MFLSTLGIREWSGLSGAQRRAAKQSEPTEKIVEKRSAVSQWPVTSAFSSTGEVTQGEYFFVFYSLFFKYLDYVSRHSGQFLFIFFVTVHIIS